jgi:hypothetical protein
MPKEEGRRKKEEGIKLIISAIKNVLITLAVAILVIQFGGNSKAS